MPTKMLYIENTDLTELHGVFEDRSRDREKERDAGRLSEAKMGQNE
jgi:hypothetical protein